MNRVAATLLPATIVEALTQKVDKAITESEARQAISRMLAQSAALQGNWNRANQGIDMKKEIVKDSIYHDLAKEGIFMRPG